MDENLPVWLAPAIALCSAAFFGFLVHLQRRGLDTTDGATGVLVNALALAGMFWITAPFWIDPGWFATRGALIFLIAGLFFPAGTLTLQMLSMPRIGPVLTGALGSFVPFFAAVPALLLFDERLGPQGWLGLGLMTLGLLLVTRNGRNFRRDWPIWMILLPLSAAAIRGGMQPVLKLAMLTAPSPAFGVMVMATVTSVVMLAARLGTGKRLPRPTRGWFWFALAGVVQGTALFLMTTAIKLGDVVVASSLAATSPLWSLLYSVAIFRREVLTPKHLAVALLVVAGGALLVTR